MEIPDGASDQVVRTVTENIWSLKFTRLGFEKELAVVLFAPGHRDFLVWQSSMTQGRDGMDWFPPGVKFAFVAARDLAAAVNSDTPQLALPSFQRDAVWDERHVELLWDSILRGFPIGAILLARGGSTDTRRMQRSQMDAAKETHRPGGGLVLIDGQQRSIAIAIGFRRWSEGDPCRLWLDLTPVDGQRDGVQFRFVLCSVRYPWGQGATEAQKREAVALSKAAAVEIDADAPSLALTWPLRAKLPVPFAEFVQLVSEGREGDWASLITRARREPPTGAGSGPSMADGLVAAVGDAARSYGVPAVLLGDMDPTDLGTAFQRLNRQGVEMSHEDLFFSGLKMRWPQAHDLVWQIHADRLVGKFLRPPQIVHMATRLTTRRMGGESDLPKLSVERFRKLADKKGPEGGEPFLDGMKHYLDAPSSPAGVGRLHGYLRLARQQLAYRMDADGSDPGLPAPMLAELDWRVWHTVVAWLDCGHRTTVSDQDRREILRFALTDLFTVRRTSDKLIRDLFDTAANASGPFPGKALEVVLRGTTETPDQSALPRPEHFTQQVLDEAKGPRWDLLANERLLAMWAQRRYLVRWFPTYDPTLFVRQEDLPFDVDHILPSAHTLRQGRRGTVAKEFWDWRAVLNNNVGNFRYWPKGQNRADGDRSPREKLFLTPGTDALPETSTLRDRPFEFETPAEVRAASCIPEVDCGYWSEAAAGDGGPHDWSNRSRLVAWRRAVMRRRAAMYAEMFEGAGFDAWIPGVSGEVG